MNKRIAEFLTELCDENERLESRLKSESFEREFWLKESKHWQTALKAAKAEIRKLKKEAK
jgi:hypothetical protein